MVPDENFHGRSPCLVAIEPVSNFILVEQYAEHRDADTWTKAIKDATLDLPVEIVLVPSDRASGLIACARDGLQARHLPEMFHGQRDLARPFHAALQRQKQAAQKQLEQAVDLAQQQQEEAAKAAAAPPHPGRKPDHSWWVEFSRREAERAAERLKACEARQEAAKAAVRGLGEDYHPFDARTGAAVMAEPMEERLGKHIKELETIKEEGQLGSKAEESAGRRTALAGGVGGDGGLVLDAGAGACGGDGPDGGSGTGGAGAVAAGALLATGSPTRPDGRRAAGQGGISRAAVERSLVGRRALASLPQEQREEVERVGKELVGLFARSSSCVEGRNGRLSLFHHGQTRLSASRLAALTVVHNYLSERGDGTTAAERFFGQKPADAFSWLLERMPDLPRPAAKRPRKAVQATPAAP